MPASSKRINICIKNVPQLHEGESQQLEDLSLLITVHAFERESFFVTIEAKIINKTECISKSSSILFNNEKNVNYAILFSSHFEIF